MPIVVLPWFSESEYPIVLAVMEDAQQLPPDFERWLRSSESLCRALEEAGREVRAVTINTAEFQRWAAQRNLRLNGLARQQWARQKAGLELER